MAVLPAEIPTGLVTGQFYFVNEDNVDADTDPELIVVDGDVTFTASAKMLRMPSKLATLIPLEFKAKFDSQGRLVTANDPSVGLELPATDSPLFNPTGFTWRVTFDLVQVANRHTVAIAPFDIQVPEGVTTDLTLAMPIDSSPGVLTIQGATGPQGPQGATGPAGPSTTNSDVAAFVSGAGATQTALDARYVNESDNVTALAGKMDKGSIYRNVKDYGAVGNGTTDDTAAIQAAIAAAGAGGTVYFPGTGSGAWYKTTATLNITAPNVRFLGQPRDGYAVSIRPSVPSIAAITVKEAGFVLQDMAIIGDGGVNGAGATITGIDFYGSTNADVDAAIVGATIQWCSVGALVRGRNAEFTRALLSNNDRGIVIDGLTAFHTGASAGSGNRGNTIKGCRFHNTGTAAIDVTTTAKVRHMVIADNYTDSNGNGVHVRIMGADSGANAHEKITIRGNKHTEVGAIVYQLTYVNNTTIDGGDIMGNTTFSNDANGIELNNCNTVTVRDTFGIQLGGSGLYARNCQNLVVDGVRWRVLGMGPGAAAHGFDVDSTNTGCSFDNLRVDSTDGWGFSGSPTDSSMSNHQFRSCTLGGINSTTLHSRASNGRNVYIEGTGGRKQDYASKSYDLADGVPTTLATILGGSNYTSFEVEVKVVGRNTAGQMYARYIRYVRPENGNPQYVTPIGDVAQGTITLAFAASGTTGVSVSATATGSTAFITAHVTAVAGGGAATGNARGVTVAMA